ncbi:MULTISPECIES: hypothetical protein [Anaeromyxobacter]|uniref:hypothetical protein n=1 Tax=Anaeromyxobacter TaxID=161492 RepID=UPI001F588BC4|nr:MULTISPECIES: hypothetical protein [unclassified Anaeromyxobacter]
MKTESGVMLSLTHDQALVLFEWLSREDGRSGLPTEHQAEQKVLWEVEAQLERALAEPLQPVYAAAVSAARERLISEGT